MGERFGQFEIERPLGVGGMAETAQAIRRGVDGFEQRVCLKRILPAFGKDAEFVRAFQNEAKLAVRLVHPHICRIYDFGCHEGTWWMSMELVEAGDLRMLFDRVETLRQPLPIDLVLLLAVDIASALHHAHSFRIDGKPAEIVHRDISPSNVLIDSAGHFKLADFGIAKATLSGEGGTRTGTIKGKVPYMAPEHARGHKIDGRADLWSFGIVLYEALAGRRPFRGAHDVELLLNVAQGTYEPIASAAPHAPPALQRLVTGLLEGDVDKRLPRAADVLELLAQTPPPANARLRLSELGASIAGERQGGERTKSKSADRVLGDAPTAHATQGGTAASLAEPTRMEQGGVALAAAPLPRSAAPDERTRTAMASVPAMETKELELRPASTDPQLALPTAVREALAIDDAVQRSAGEESLGPPGRGASGPTPFAVEGTTGTATVASPHAQAESTRRLAQVIAGSAFVGLLGLGLGAWGLGVFDGAARDGMASGAIAVERGAAGAAVSAAGAPPDPAAMGDGVPSARGAAPPLATSSTGAPGAMAVEPPVVEIEPVLAPSAIGTPPVVEAAAASAASAPVTEVAMPEDDSAAAVGEPAAEAATGPAGGEREARPMGTVVVGVVGFGSVWIDGRRVASSTDHLERRLRAGRHTVAAGIDAPHESREIDVVAGESVEVLLHAR